MDWERGGREVSKGGEAGKGDGGRGDIGDKRRDEGEGRNMGEGIRVERERRRFEREKKGNNEWGQNEGRDRGKGEMGWKGKGEEICLYQHGVCSLSPVSSVKFRFFPLL